MSSVLDALRVFDALPQQCAYLDRGLVYRYANAAYLKSRGLAASEVLGRPAVDVHGADALVHVRALADRVLQGQTVPFQITMPYRSGPRNLEGTAVPDVDADGRVLGYYAVATDVTEQRQAEHSLRESEARYRHIFENAHVGVYRTTPDGRILVANAALLAMLGFDSLEEAQRRNLEDEGFGKRVGRSHFRDLVETHGEVRGLESEWQTRDGRPLMVRENARAVRDAQGNVVCYEGTVEDVTERHRIEASLGRYAKRLAALREVDRGVLGARSPEELASVVTRRLRGLVPCDRVSVVLFDDERGDSVVLAAEGLGTENVGAGVRLPFSSEVMPAAMRAGHEMSSDDVTAEPDSPSRRLALRLGVRAMLRVPLMVQGRQIGQLGLGRLQAGSFSPEEIEVAREIADTLAVGLANAELSRRLRAHAQILERRVEERTAELRQALADQESFSYSVSHDLRAPLRAMHGLSQALVEDYGDRLDDVGRDYVRRIMHSSQKLDRLINDLLDYGRLSNVSLALEPVALDPLLDRVLHDLDAEVSESGALVEVVRPLPTVLGHSATLGHVFLNLLGNALKFVAPGTVPCVRVAAEVNEGVARVSVTDNGIGVDPEHRERIFRVFERLYAENVYPGTGIGLAIVQKAMTRLGGRVGLESEAGRGSTFWIELPVA